MNQYPAERRISIFVHIAEPLLRAGVFAAMTHETDLNFFDVSPAVTQARIDVIVADAITVGTILEDFRNARLPPSLQSARILVVAAQIREHAVRSALKQGIHGFVSTSSPVKEFLAAVRTLAAGNQYVCTAIVKQLAEIGRRNVLTCREDEVLRLMANGLCNKSIARSLDIAVGTVKVHIRSIMSKLDASTRTEAASIANRRGLVDALDFSAHRVEPLYDATAWPGANTSQACYA